MRAASARRGAPVFAPRHAARAGARPHCTLMPRAVQLQPDRPERELVDDEDQDYAVGVGRWERRRVNGIFGLTRKQNGNDRRRWSAYGGQDLRPWTRRWRRNAIPDRSHWAVAAPARTNKDGTGAPGSTVRHPPRTKGNQTAPGWSRSVRQWGAPPGPARRGPVGTSLRDGKPHLRGGHLLAEVQDPTVNGAANQRVQEHQFSGVGV
jgi:hypothetical protein